MGRFKLLDLNYIMIQRWGKAFGRGFPLGSWQEGFLKGEKITPNALGLFKRFSKKNSNEKHLMSQHKMEKNLQDQNQVLGESKQNTCHKRKSLRGRVL